MLDIHLPSSGLREEIRSGLDALFKDPEQADVIAADAVFDLAWPLPQTTGQGKIIEQFVAPLQAAFTGLHRRDLMFIGGENIRSEGGFWCTAVTHYVGNFDAPLWGISPSHKLSFLRAGEFFRIEDGQIIKARIIFDLPDLMRQIGRAPLPSLGNEITFPAPATQDGLCPDPAGGAASLTLVERMLASLHVFDPRTMTSPEQTGEHGTWANDMMWYGPGGIGSSYLWDGFVKDHREAFLTAFPDRKGGNHYCRIGDGAYAAVSGWPSMTMTHRGDYLGVPATGKSLTLRVMDFYRTASGRIAENWVLLDYGELFDQMGINLIERSEALR
ncbi:ester cyclase [Aestuariibius insulae]|uniref:nuclear transport factor 2 family protein n=1 Tax=Aestuariibius insulae TaxID=2058287 RepID=UPI00345E28D6